MSGFFTRLRPIIQCARNIKQRVEFYHLQAISSFSETIKSNSNRFHVYVSGTRDPYLNLSIEHYIYQKSALDSTILLLYIDDPCVVIGRNQNPWLEANLKSLSQRNIPLIRRRSGGGTVFHDRGNVNFSFIYPPGDFTRDKYVELVTRALRIYQPRARVNERHDIVIDQGDKLDDELELVKGDMHRSGYESSQPRKCSGSAYKLSRNRALHHGTCLVNSPNLNLISDYLRSPLEPFIKARGVDSVRSPVMNAFASSQENAIEKFVTSVIQTFNQTHHLGIADLTFPSDLVGATQIKSVNEGMVYGILGQDLRTVDLIHKGMEELKSDCWLWGQTPSFTFSSFPTEEDNRSRPQLPDSISSTTRLHFGSRSGRILSADMSISPLLVFDEEAFVDKHIHQFTTWKEVLQIKYKQVLQSEDSMRQISKISSWLDELFSKTPT